MLDDATIVAIATPPGRGGVGVIRISGVNVKNIAINLLGKITTPRYASYLPFYDQNNLIIDHGIALFFPAPHSFTGEDILELHGHGGPIVLDGLLQRIVQLGARLARPGEFSERAFLNGKIDLTQAEAIADLINCSSQQAAHAAINSLQGKFSQHIKQLLDELIHLRMYVEASIDFSEEEINFLNDGKVINNLNKIIYTIEQTITSAQQGHLLQEGISIVIIGRPNAGKSSLLNQLAGRDTAIVTDIPGTTRDVLHEYIHIDGMPLHIIDTAGLRDSPDLIEQEGIRRAWKEVNNAHQILLVIDNQEATTEQSLKEQINNLLPVAISKPVIVIWNKVDLLKQQAEQFTFENYIIIRLSAKTGEGIDILRKQLTKSAGYQAQTEGIFLARRRHLDALDETHQRLLAGKQQLECYQALELLAEELMLAQRALGEITGEFSNEELLGKIFASFCIGK